MIRPHGNFILVEPMPAPTETAGGLAIPEAFVVDPPQGLVLDVGPGRATRDGREPLPVRPGARVLFNKNSGWRFRSQGDRWALVGLADQHQDQDVLLIPHTEVLCVVKGEV